MKISRGQLMNNRNFKFDRQFALPTPPKMKTSHERLGVQIWQVWLTPSPPTDPNPQKLKTLDLGRTMREAVLNPNLY